MGIIFILSLVIGCSKNIEQTSIITCSSESTLKFSESCLKETSNPKCRILLGNLYNASIIICGDPTYPIWRCVGINKEISSSYLFSDLQLEQCLLK